MSSDDRKRPALEETQLGVSPARPIKRRSTGYDSKLASSPLHDSDQSGYTEKWIEDFQKEAIWRQSQEYKRRATRCEFRLSRSSTQQAEKDAYFSTAKNAWEETMGYLLELLKRINEDSRLKSLLNNAGSTQSASLFAYTLSDTTLTTHDSLKHLPPIDTCQALIASLNDLLAAWLKRRAKFVDDALSGVEGDLSAVEKLKDGYRELNLRFMHKQKAMNELQGRCHALEMRKKVLEVEGEVFGGRIKTAKGYLDQMREEIGQAASKAEKLEPNSTTNTPAVTGDHTGSNVPAKDTSGETTVTVPPNGDAAVVEAQQQQRELQQMNMQREAEMQLLDETRQNEIQAMHEERARLDNEAARIRSQIVGLPEERIKETMQYRTLQLALENVSALCDDLEERLREVTASLEEERRSKNQLIEGNSIHQGERERMIEKEIKKVEADLERVQAQRDQLKQQVNSRQGKEEARRAEVESLLRAVEKQREQLKTLPAEIERLSAMANEVGGEQFKHFLEEERQKLGELEKEADEEELRASVLLVQRDIKRRAREGRLDVDSAHSREMELREQVEALERTLRDYEAQVTASELAKQVCSVGEAIVQADLKLAYYEKFEPQLLAEIENIGRAYAAFEEQGPGREREIRQRDERSGKLRAEISKYEQKIAELASQVEQQSEAVAKKRLTSERQAEMVGRLGERVRGLDGQIANIEKEVVQRRIELVVQREALQNASRIASEMKQRLQQSEALLAEAQRLLAERTQQWEHEVRARQRAEEEVESLRKRAEKLKNTDRNEELNRRRKEYLGLLKCAACNINFKTHLLARCLHVFCKGCIDSRLETRQRKCPACGESFGVNDVQRFYL
ncbi:uncharacterized protein VTP21DRAFT_5480 [Calcarisporiella thermophila]|uniref:uncharacterized protein n=1 Tax=Calcarisporiella thermophila TaxID=911321 RepID=UPI0037421248